MKKLIKLPIATIFMLLLFVNCSKSKVKLANYFRGKIDGITFEFNTNIHANKPLGQTTDQNLRLTAGWPGYVIQLDIVVTDSSLSAGTYVFEAGISRSATLVEEQGVNPHAFYAGSNNCFGCNSQLPLSGSGKITILEISRDDIKGTFEFITDSELGTKVIKTITDGEFYTKRG